MNSLSIDRFAKSQEIEKLSILIAVYNEIETIKTCLNDLWKVTEVFKFPVETIVVESNSSDGTRELLKKIAQNNKMILILQDHAYGKGSAIRLAMQRMTGDVFMIYDADDEYDPLDIPKLLLPIVNGQTSFVLGTRHVNGKVMRQMDNHIFRPYLMNVAHVIFTKLINLFCSVHLTDPFTMYKIFRSEIFQGVQLHSNRFDLDWELVIKAVKAGVKPIEIPITYKSRSFSEGKKVKFFRDPVSWIIALFRYRFTSF